MPEGGTTTRTGIVGLLHDRPPRGVIYVTGGGSMLLSDLLEVPGASATLLEARIPYSQDALASLLGASPEQACNAETARDLAMCAFLRANALAPGEETFGFAITASLRSTRPKKGEHRAHCALQTPTHTVTTSISLAKGERSRKEEERLVAHVALSALAEAFGVDAPVQALKEADTLESRVAEGDTEMRALLSGARPAIGAGAPTAMKFVPLTGSPPMPMQVVWPNPAIVVWWTPS